MKVNFDVKDKDVNLTSGTSRQSSFSNKLKLLPFLIPVIFVVYLIISNTQPYKLNFDEFDFTFSIKTYVKLLILLLLLLLNRIENTFAKKIKRVQVVKKIDLFLFKILALKGRIPLFLLPSSKKYDMVEKHCYILIVTSILNRILLWTPHKEIVTR